MKKYIVVIVLIIVLALNGCSKSSMDYSYEEGLGYNNEDTKLETPDPIINEPTDQGGGVTNDSAVPALLNRKIIYRADLVMAVSNPTLVYNEVIITMGKYTAYVEEASITPKNYQIIIRVISSEFDTLIEDIKTSGELVSFSKTSEDITNAYSTFDARREALEVRHTRILELITIATDLDMILRLEEERFEIEAELNQIGLQLANFDSLVDYSTVTLIIKEAVEEIIVLPRVTTPISSIIEITKNSITVEIYNDSEENVILNVDLYLNGEFITEYEENIFNDSKTVVTFDELKSNKEYTIKITAIGTDTRVSLEDTLRTDTLKTYGNRTTNTFVQSWSLLVTIFEFLGLAVTGLFPFAVVGAIIFVPVRILIVRRRRKNS